MNENLNTNKNDKLNINQYESIMANLDRILKAKFKNSPFKQRSISIPFERYLMLNTDFETEEKEE